MEKLSELQLAPIRSMNDFLIGTAIFQAPNFGDIEKWGNRVINNLLYYQTNYFAIVLIVILAMTFAYPSHMVIGFLVTAIGYAGYYHMSNIEGAIKTFKNTHPMAVFGCITTASVLVLYLLDSLLIFAFCVLLPFSITFVHASFRKRNTKNKIINKVEEMGLKKSPMGLFLSALSLEPKIFS